MWIKNKSHSNNNSIQRSTPTNVLNSYVLLTYKRSWEAFLQWCRNRGARGATAPPPNILLISYPYSNRGRVDCPQPLLLAPPNFFTLRHRCFYVMSSLVACQNCYKLAYLFILIHIVYRPLIFQIKFYNLAYLSMLIHTYKPWILQNILLHFGIPFLPKYERKIVRISAL